MFGFCMGLFRPFLTLFSQSLRVALLFAIAQEQHGFHCLAADIKVAPAKVVRLTRDSGFKQHLSWSPDGKKFLFTRIHKGKMALWTMNADGSGLKRLLPNEKNPHFDGHWSP